MCLAVPGKIAEIFEESDAMMRKAKVDFGGISKEVSLVCVPEAKLGDYVMVHVGFAISVVNLEEAQKVFDYLQKMNELGELYQTQ